VIFSDFTKLICCYFVINQQVLLLAKVEILRVGIKNKSQQLTAPFGFNEGTYPAGRGLSGIRRFVARFNFRAN
jgi:hypothetical protein